MNGYVMHDKDMGKCILSDLSSKQIVTNFSKGELLKLFQEKLSKLPPDLITIRWVLKQTDEGYVGLCSVDGIDTGQLYTCSFAFPYVHPTHTPKKNGCAALQEGIF